MAVPFFKPGETAPWAVIPGNPSLNNAFFAECEETISRIAALSDPGKIRYLHISDIHIGANIGGSLVQCLSALVHMAENIGADFILGTGDIITGATGDAEVQKAALLNFREFFKDCPIPVIISRGNHDDNSIAGLSEENIVGNNWWNFFMGTGLNAAARNIITPAGGNGYFYMDIPTKKLRVVNINCSDLNDEERLSKGGQNWLKLSQKQLDWLSNTAFSVDEGWKIICSCHMVPVAALAVGSSITNKDALYSVLKDHAEKIIAFNAGHTHVSCNWVDENGIRFITANTCGGSVISAAERAGGYGISSVSKEAREAAPTGAMLFDICIVNEDNTVSRIRWGVEDDVFRDE